MLSMYSDQLLQLEWEVLWNGKCFELHQFEDYKFQSKCYGLSGPSGSRPCLHCLCPKKSMDRPWHQATERTETESVNHLSNQQQTMPSFNNVLRPPILPVKMDNVIIPVHHMDQRIFPWVFKAFQPDVHALDT